MSRVTLYRATDRTDSYASGCCFATDRETAEAYTDNPGYGGQTIVEVTIDVDRGDVLRLVGSDGRMVPHVWEHLAEALGVDTDEDYAVERLRDDSECLVERAIDDRRNRATLAAAGYQWVVYEDTYPVGAVTWVYLGEAVTL